MNELPGLLQVSLGPSRFHSHCWELDLIPAS